MKYWTVLKRRNGNSWYATDQMRTASHTRCHLHAGKRPCGPLRCDEAIGMQVEGLDALENAVRHDSTLAGTADA